MERYTREHLTADLRCDRFAEGPDYATIRHLGTDDWMLFWTGDGGGIIRTADDQPLICRRYHCTLIAPGCRQHYACDRNIGHWHFCWAHFQTRPQWVPLLRLPERAPGIVHERLDNEALHHRIDRSFAEMIDAHHGDRPHALLRAQNALERILIDLHDHLGRGGDEHPGLERVLRHLALRCDRPHRIDDLAALAGLSASRFAHLFRERVGQAPAAYVERLRLQRASELLHDCDWPIAEIAAAVGYDDPLYFSARFKKSFGSAPRTWRRLSPVSPSKARQRSPSSSRR